MMRTACLERDLRAKTLDRTASGMTNGQCVRMKHQPWRSGGIAIKRIAKYRVADFLQVNAQLM